MRGSEYKQFQRQLQDGLPLVLVWEDTCKLPLHMIT